ncbi:MAG: M20/M25/M40 family metallo-hydrolase [Planctomycetes bacterium]|nr:M20/M25/M40 family metallo-hydrolase [Planctomycetota bacterium]
MPIISKLAVPTPANLRKKLIRAVQRLQPQAESLLAEIVRIPSISGREKAVVRRLAQWARACGFSVDVFETDEKSLAGFPEAAAGHLPLKGRPTLVIRHPGRERGRSLLFNAHSDVVAAPEPERWRHGPWSGFMARGRLYGRGACDSKGPLVSALLAMQALREIAAGADAPRGDILLELVPGEEDCVGLGTLTSLMRGYRADAVVILEPTEGQPRCASRSGLRFRITVAGRAVHGTLKWLGRDAIADLRRVLAALERMERKFNRKKSNQLFADYPILRPITVDQIQGGSWPGMVCDQALCTGYFELPPDEDISVWKRRFQRELEQRMGKAFAAGDMKTDFIEEYSGHATAPEHPLCRLAERILQINERKLAWKGWKAFNSGCEAGLRWRRQGVPTLVWGPGSLEQAHAVDEFVDLAAVRDTAVHLALLAYYWTHDKENS